MPSKVGPKGDGTNRTLSALLDDGKNTISSQLMGQLREAIVSGALRAGTKINLDRVRTDLRVSLSPLREALARLIADGLVEFEDNRGYRVAPVSMANLDEITLLREEFETYALREAIRLGDIAWESNVIRALHVVNRTERDAKRPETLETWEAAHRVFHLTLIAACDKPLLLGFCAKLLDLNDRYRRTFLGRISDHRDVMMEHDEIAQAVVARDADLACAKLREHLARTGGDLRRLVTEAGAE